VAVLAQAMEAHMLDFIDQPESFDTRVLVAANIARHYARLLDGSRVGDQAPT
jgi:hypothetical protein